MKSSTFYNALIHAIETIYQKISVILLHKRMDRYHKEPTSGQRSYANGIKSPLLDSIDDIIANQPDNSEASPGTGQPAIDSTARPNTPAKNHTGQAEMLENKNAEEFSKHVKASTNGTELYPEIAKKLEHSVWDHIHAAIRHARQGDKRNASMHTDIANSASKELAHYMNEEHFQAFLASIEKYLDSLEPARKKPIQ